MRDSDSCEHALGITAPCLSHAAGDRRSFHFSVFSTCLLIRSCFLSTCFLSEAFTHLPSSVPFISKASPSLLQDNLKLCFRWASHQLSQCNSRVCDVGTRELAGEMRTLVASVCTKQRHQLTLRAPLTWSRARHGVTHRCPHKSKPHAMLVALQFPDTTHLYCLLPTQAWATHKIRVEIVINSLAISITTSQAWGGKENVSEQMLPDAEHSTMSPSSASGHVAKAP